MKFGHYWFECSEWWVRSPRRVSVWDEAIWWRVNQVCGKIFNTILWFNNVQFYSLILMLIQPLPINDTLSFSKLKPNHPSYYGYLATRDLYHVTNPKGWYFESEPRWDECSICQMLIFNLYTSNLICKHIFNPNTPA